VDHFPVVYELDVEPARVTHTPWPMWRKTDWDEFRGSLAEKLTRVPVPEVLDTREQVDAALRELDRSVWECINNLVPMSRPSPYVKRWWSEKLTQL
jgi:hypothetical protein